MKPGTPFIQSFDRLPGTLPSYTFENALLPGGELPLELSRPADLALFFRALRTDQLIGMVQPQPGKQPPQTYRVGCAGRIRQYRERKDGRLNIMLTGVCRYRLIDEEVHKDGYTLTTVDWSDFEIDYASEEVEVPVVDAFKLTLRNYFDRHSMQVDWKVLDKQPVEQLINNLVLVMNLGIDSKQRLLESPDVRQRLALFSRLLEEKADPIRISTPGSHSVN